MLCDDIGEVLAATADGTLSLDDFASKVLSAMRKQFGGHVERPAGG